jgi:sporulation protein YlmC with PRC-barrel domain
MKRFSAVVLLFAATMMLFGQGTAPRMLSVTPDEGRTEEVYTTTGENLGKAQVKDVFLTNGKDDIKMVIVSQTNESIQFKVPAGTKAGRYSLMVFTTDEMQYIEQPVRLTIVVPAS